ncbi:MAG: Hint domain-containing protein [Cognatishimia sp.]|uniref:Hint domain-containing protein n=1 Tax=Cognatishimia sp. TaxID=2211648 RepID=UPI003B8DCF5E
MSMTAKSIMAENAGVGARLHVKGWDMRNITIRQSDTICFAQDAKIATMAGERPVQALREGERVITRDNGLQEIAWIGKRSLDAIELAANPHLQPILIKAGSLGHNQPETDLMVSPNHRMLIANDANALLFDERETLVAAKHLVGKPGVTKANVAEVTYFHILFEQHEVVLGNGAWSESFQPGDYSVSTLSDAQRTEIFTLFPELENKGALQDFAVARRSLNKQEASLVHIN